MDSFSTILTFIMNQATDVFQIADVFQIPANCIVPEVNANS